MSMKSNFEPDARTEEILPVTSTVSTNLAQRIEYVPSTSPAAY